MNTKWILLILLLIFSVPHIANGGTLYSVSSTSLDSIANATDGQDGLGRMQRKILVPAVNNWIILVGSSLSNQADVVTYNGSTWAGTTGIFDNYSGYNGLIQNGDSAFLIGLNGAYPIIAKINGVTIGLKDTVGSQTASSSANVAAAIVGTGGDSILYEYRTETGSTDTVFDYVSNGNLTATTTWTKNDTMTIAQSGVRAAFRGGWVNYNEIDNDLIYHGRTGIDTLSVNNFSHTFATPTGSRHLQYSITVFNDTVFQAWSVGDSAYIKRGVISGTIPSMTITTIDSQKVWSSADLPSPVVSTGEGYLYTWPEVCVFRSGTHTLAMSKHWANQANLDSIDIMYSEFVGGSWSAWTVFMPATDNFEVWRLHAPYTTPLVGSSTVVPILIADSTGTTNRDSAYVYAETITFSSTTPTITGVVKESIVSRSILKARPEVIWREE